MPRSGHPHMSCRGAAIRTCRCHADYRAEPDHADVRAEPDHADVRAEPDHADVPALLEVDELGSGPRCATFAP
jgi:hypothetical protein